MSGAAGRPRLLGSDNQAGVHPRILEAVERAGHGAALAYGDDPWTAQLADCVRDVFGSDAIGFPVFGGTGANVVALAALTSRWEAVVCSDVAHIGTDESAAPEQLIGVKLVTVATPDGRLTPSALTNVVTGRRTIHQSRLAVLSLTQSTELGTVYSPSDIAVLAEFAHRHGMRVHVDGARLANAAAHEGLGLAAVSLDAGADLVCVGGTKIGLMFGELLVTRDPGIAARVERARKGTGQLASKQRFVSVQLAELLTDGLWRDLAAASNDAAGRLAASVTGLAGVEVAFPVEANAVFLRCSEPVRTVLEDEFGAVAFHRDGPVVRLVCAWDVTAADLDQVARRIRAAASG